MGNLKVGIIAFCLLMVVIVDFRFFFMSLLADAFFVGIIALVWWYMEDKPKDKEQNQGLNGPFFVS